MQPIAPLPIHDLANIVPRASHIEQQALDLDIATEGFDRTLGLLSMYKGQLFDGRNRQDSLLKAGLDPRDYTQDIGDIPLEEATKKAHRLQARRNLTMTQKVIYAYNKTQLPKGRGRLSQAESATKTGVSVSMIKHAGTISKYALLLNSSLYSTNIYKVEKVATSSYSRKIATTNILQNLFDGHFIKVGNEPATDSIKMIAKRLKELYESNDLLEESAISEWRADAFIETEAGKRYYREAVTLNHIPESSVALRMMLAELANFKFRLASTYIPIEDHEETN